MYFSDVSNFNSSNKLLLSRTKKCIDLLSEGVKFFICLIASKKKKDNKDSVLVIGYLAEQQSKSWKKRKGFALLFY